ncbi:MAG: glycine cleavage system protein GcvH [Thermoplasmata archaeon]|nr:glycine cleavage system protein GcvH [Thermoplasmata archaeon]
MEIDNRMKYAKTHEWVLVEGKKAKIGVSDYAQQQLTDIVFVELPEINAKIEKGKSFGVIESVKAVEDVYAPVSGKVTARNQKVIDSPELINNDPYNAWLIEVEMENLKELDELMNADQYKKFLETESH